MPIKKKNNTTSHTYEALTLTLPFRSRDFSRWNKVYEFENISPFFLLSLPPSQSLFLLCSTPLQPILSYSGKKSDGLLK